MGSPFERLFRAKDIKHVSGQEGPVHNVTKAREMAETEDISRKNFAISEYRAYLADPSADTPLSKRFEEFREYGVTPEYLEAIADVHGERVGAEYDAQLSAKNKSDVRLAFEELLGELRLVLGTTGLEPTQGLPPHSEAVNKATAFETTLSNYSAVGSELLRRRYEQRREKSA